MPQLFSKEEMDGMDFGDESDDEPVSTEMLDDIHERSQSCLNVNRREERYKICDSIKQRKSERKGALKATRNMGRYLHKVFRTVLKEISQDLPPLGESGSEFSHFIPEPRNVSEVTKLSYEMKKPMINAIQKEIKNIINNQNFLVQEPEKGETVNPCIDVYKAKI